MRRMSLAPYLTFTLFMVTFAVGSFLAVKLFVSNPSKLAKSRATSVRDLTVHHKEVNLDESQQKLVDLATKFMLLYGIAVLSTMCCWIISVWVTLYFLLI